MDTLDVLDSIRIPMSEIRLTAIRSQGAGGQNVNKVSSAIHLRFDVQNSAAVPDRIKARLLKMPDHRISSDGVIVIKSQAYRTQERNRQAALSRLADLIRSAAPEKKSRIATRPSKQAKLKRLEDKSRRGSLKRTRNKVAED